MREWTVGNWPLALIKLAITVYLIWEVGPMAILLCAMLSTRVVALMQDRHGNPVYVEKRRWLFRKRRWLFRSRQ